MLLRLRSVLVGGICLATSLSAYSVTWLTKAAAGATISDHCAPSAYPKNGYPKWGSVCVQGAAWAPSSVVAADTTYHMDVFSNGARLGLTKHSNQFANEWQCTELAVRWAHYAWGEGNANSWTKKGWDGAGVDMYRIGSKLSIPLQRIPNGSSGQAPLPGDLIVFRGDTVGHVGVVLGINRSTKRLTFIGENQYAAPAVVRIPITPGNYVTSGNFSRSLAVVGWLHDPNWTWSGGTSSGGSGTAPTPAPPSQGGTIAYVTDDNLNEISPVDVANGSLGSPISVPGGPSGIAITPDGKTAYVVATTSNNVIPVTLATGAVGTPISVPGVGVNIAITPDGRTAYVTAGLGNSITPITLATGTVGTPIAVPNSVGGIAITPNGRTAYVTDVGGTVTPVDLSTGTAGTPISVSGGPAGIAITPDGRTAYVAKTASDTVVPIDLATGTVGSAISVANGVEGGIAVTPNDKTVYVTTGGGTINPIDIATKAVGAPIDVPIGDGAGLAIAP